MNRYNESYLPKSLEDLIQRDKRRHQKKKEQQRQNQRDDVSEPETEYFTDDNGSADQTETVTTTTTTVVVKKTRAKNSKSKPTVTPPGPKSPTIQVPPPATIPKRARKEKGKYSLKSKTLPSPPRYNGHTRDTRVGVGAQREGPSFWKPVRTAKYNYNYTGPANEWSRPASPSPPEPPKDKATTKKIFRDDDDILYLGLKVYANTGEDGEEVEVKGRLGDALSDDDGDRPSERGRSRSRRSTSRSRSVSQRRSRSVSSSLSPVRR